MVADDPQPQVESPRAAARRRKASGIVVPHSPRWFQRLGAWLVFALVRTVSATLRYQWSDRSGYFDHGTPGPAIYCVWHNRLALCLVPYFGYVKKHNQTPGMAALVSASKDGAFLAGILECFGVHPVRGSSSRRGPQALLELTGWAERGYDLAITPDGPRGPRYVVQEGAIGLAQITGFPIIPASYNRAGRSRPRAGTGFNSPCLSRAVKWSSESRSGSPANLRMRNARPCGRNWSGR